MNPTQTGKRISFVSEIRSNFNDVSSSSSLDNEIKILSSSPLDLASMANEINEGRGSAN